VSCSVCLEQLCNVRDQWIVGIGVRQEGANAQEYLGNGQSGRPLVLENVQANTSIGVDVTVIDACGEVDLGRLKGVIGGKVNVKEKDSAGVRRIIGAHDGGLPVEHVVSDGSSRAVGRRVLAKIYQFCGVIGKVRRCETMDQEAREQQSLFQRSGPCRAAVSQPQRLQSYLC
jgi:hypothetical protein